MTTDIVQPLAAGVDQSELLTKLNEDIDAKQFSARRSVKVSTLDSIATLSNIIWQTCDRIFNMISKTADSYRLKLSITLI
jgi:hypothetical protein